MHNNYNDIEQRLKDFQSFEHEITSDVWQNLEGDLMLNNSIAGLNDLEFDIDNSIWEGIEDRITVKRPKTAIWWLPGSIAAMLLLALSTYNLDLINSESNISVNQPISNKVNTSNDINTQKDNSLTANEDINISSESNYAENINSNLNQNISNTDFDNSQNSESNSQEVFAVQSSVLSSSKLLSNNSNSNSKSYNKTITTTESKINNSSKNKVTDNLKVSNANLIALNDTKLENKNLSSNGIDNSILLPNNSNSEFKNSLVNNLNSVSIINSDIENVNTNTINNSSLSNSDNVLSSNNNLQNNHNSLKTVLIDSLEKEDENVELVGTINENILLEEDEEDVKNKSWKLIALVGVGNFRNIEESFNVVDPALSAPVGGLKNGGPKLETIQESEGKVGLNYIKYAKPITFSFGVQKQITNNFGLRVGVNYSKLRTDFEIYSKKYALSLNYISVPVMGVLTVKSWKKVKLNTLAHIRVEKLINHRYLVINDEEKKYEDYYIQNEKINLLVGIGGELEVDLNKNVSIVTNIKVNRYLFTDTQEEFIRDKQIVWPEFNIGLSQKF